MSRTQQQRRLVALDYRGHGRSQYSHPRNYGIHRDLADLAKVVTALGISSAIFVGTSHGGVLALMLARSQPSLVAGVILNDIGPVIEPRAALQIRDLGKLPVGAILGPAAEILRQIFGARFLKLTSRDWIAFAKRTWREHHGALVLDYDVRLARTLDANLEHSPSTLWEAFANSGRGSQPRSRGCGAALKKHCTARGTREQFTKQLRLR